MLEVRHITHEFPGIKALDDVSVQFYEGEIHALMGENGAGKSTLMKVITGIYHADAGEVCIDGQAVDFKSYRDSIHADISMVHQEIQVIPDSTVAENIVLDKLDEFKNKVGMLNWKKINQTARVYLGMVDLAVQPTDIIGPMTAAQKQLIQIAKALSLNARYILMDEPTSSLTSYEVKNLFRIIRKLKAENRCIIFVSHKIEEVLSLADSVTVLRDGCVVGTRNTCDINRQILVHMMIGREENIEAMGTLNIDEEVVLKACNISKAGQFNNISLCLRKGEILGLYGLVGAGRTELARLLVGADKMDSGEVFIHGSLAHIRSMGDALYRYNMGYVTENRKEEGLILPFSVQSNLTVTILRRLVGKLFKINDKKGRAVSQEMTVHLDIKTPSQNTSVENLSGGNQQKVSIGKWLAAGCDILIIDEPTVGVDVGAKRYIHELIWNLCKREGKSIILISSDMPEMITLARRILVFKNFRIAVEIDNLNQETVDYTQVSEWIGSAMA